MASRRGFTFVELIMGIVVLGILSVGMTKLLISQMRFYDKQAANGVARSVARSSLNRIIADFRTVDGDSGVVSATSTDITVRAPYAIGISCTRSTISLLPVDSAVYTGSPGGYAWRGSSDIYTYVESGVSIATSSATACADSSVVVLTSDGGRQLSLSPALPNNTPAKGTVVLLTHRVRYQFKNSTIFPGSLGLYRQQLTPSLAEEEIAAPFSSDSKFRFFDGNSTTAQDNVPASLTTLRGFELVLGGQSETIPSGETTKRTETFTTAVFFKNRRN